jgi:putative RNA 2'-phosphotransferase
MVEKKISQKLETKISKYMSYLLRHEPKDLKLDEEGFVNLDNFLKVIQERFNWLKKEDLISMAERNERYEVLGDKIRAIYGHSIEVTYKLEETFIDKLYHGTASDAAEKILKEGLKAMGRNKVHLSATVKAAIRVGKRRTKNPIILVIDASGAIKEGIKIEKATDLVYLTDYIPPKFISILD